MNLAVIIPIAVGLAMDAFAVAVASSLRLHPVNRRQVFRLAFHFGLFQALMPVAGYFTAASVSAHIEAWDHWVAFALLAGIGVKMLVEAYQERPEEELARRDPTRGLRLVALSVATSIDAFAVGLSFALLRLSLWETCAVIGLITGLLTALGMAFGARIGLRFSRVAETAGGIILIAVGVRIVVNHLGQAPL